MSFLLSLPLACALHTAQRPFFIGVAGGTASGKTSVVDKVVKALRHESVVSITLDCFYRDLSQAEKEQAHACDFDFDHPNAFDFDHLLEVVEQLKCGGGRTHSPHSCRTAKLVGRAS